jgi:proteasome assembly chaperone (PAC2) family protein
VDSVVFLDQPTLQRPVLVTAFHGWNDAGESASGAAEFLLGEWEAEPFAYLDPEEFFDFQVNRPTVRLEDGVSRVIEWPSNEFHHARVGGRDVVIFLGREPNIRWRTFATAIVDVGRTFGAEQLVTLGAFLADVAHTRAVPVVGSAASPAEAEQLGLSTSRYEGPTGITGVVHDLSNKAGLASVSFWAAVPHYVPAGVNPKAALALVRRLGSFIGVDVDPGSLGPASVAWERRVDELLQENDTLAEYVRKLEETAVEELAPGNIPSGEAIAAEVERFLRERGPQE